MTSTGPIRMSASDVGVDPAVAGQGNVQAALAALGGGNIGTFADIAIGVTSAPIAFDGTTHNADCVPNVPPAWLNGFGQITQAGLYAISASMGAAAAITTPGLFGYIITPLYGYAAIGVPLDLLSAIGAFVGTSVVAIGQADVPTSATCQFHAPVDGTGTYTTTVTIQRLAS